MINEKTIIQARKQTMKSWTIISPNLLPPTTDVPSAKYAARRVLASFVFAQSNIPITQ